MLLQGTIRTRNDFGRFLNERELKRAAVEIGTHRAQWTVQFMSRWAGQKLWSVDCWSIPAGYERQAKFLWTDDPTRYADYRQAVLETENDPRIILMKSTSQGAAPMFQDDVLDFVYLDGDHELPGFQNDLDLWWPKVKPGGILAGHDFICATRPAALDNWGRFIQPAVMALAEREGLPVFLVPEPDGWWSFYLEKPK
jgi:hypothetical protein